LILSLNYGVQQKKDNRLTICCPLYHEIWLNFVSSLKMPEIIRSRAFFYLIIQHAAIRRKATAMSIPA